MTACRSSKAPRDCCHEGARTDLTGPEGVENGLEAGVVASDVAGGGSLGRPPAGATALRQRLADCRGVVAEPGNDDVGVALVGVDGDPGTGPGRPPAARQRARGERPLQHSGGVEEVTDGAGTVVALRIELAMPAAPQIRLRADSVAGVDRLPDLPRGVARRDRGSVRSEERRVGKE